MKILFAVSEAIPFAASGGLADVGGSLPRAIRNRGNACRVAQPFSRAVQRRDHPAASGGGHHDPAGHPRTV